MRRYRDRLLLSASDLVTFLGCRHATVLDRRQLDHPVPVTEDDAYTKILKEKGFEHEHALRARLQAEGGQVVEIIGIESLKDRTVKAMDTTREGVEVVYQGALHSDPWHGYADVLLRVNADPAKMRALLVTRNISLPNDGIQYLSRWLT